MRGAEPVFHGSAEPVFGSAGTPGIIARLPFSRKKHSNIIFPPLKNPTGVIL